MKRLLLKSYFVVFILLSAFAAVFPQNDSAPQMRQGFQYLQSENFSSAVNTFSGILRSEPNNAQARLGLAIALIGIEKFADASREIAKLLARSPKDAKLLEMAAQSFWQHDLPKQKKFLKDE
jgi:Flp pilus assembly protein TadD